MIIKKILSAAASTISFFILLLSFFTNSNAQENNSKYFSNDNGILSIMYHRFEENKYPSTNIRMEVFKEHIKIIKKLDYNFNKPEFFISNAENPRTTHVKTLDVLHGKFELFERFEVGLSIGAEMPTFPFGNLDLFLDIASFSGSTKKMVFQPESLEIGHHDVDAHSHKVIKGAWSFADKYMEIQNRSSLNHGGKEKFSYLIT